MNYTKILRRIRSSKKLWDISHEAQCQRIMAKCKNKLGHHKFRRNIPMESYCDSMWM